MELKKLLFDSDFSISSFIPQPFLHLAAKSSLVPSHVMQLLKWWKIHLRVLRKLVDAIAEPLSTIYQ